MKDSSKTISERATRFLPVDMKDRLKSAFHRNPATSAPDNAREAEAPDYTAIFNTNRNDAALKNSRPVGAGFSGQVDEAELRQPSISAGAKNPARQIAQDIEEAEIVVEPGDETPISAEWESVALKTRKVPASFEKRAAPADALSDFHAIFKPEQPRLATSRSARRSSLEAGLSALAIEERRSVFKADAKTLSREDATPPPEDEGKYEHPKNGEAVSQKSKSRFFGDFASTESVRLKVEKRNEKRPIAPMQSSDVQPAQPETGPAEVNALSSHDGVAFEFEPAQQPSDADRSTAEADRSRPVTLEEVSINLPEEYSMDTKAHESENGAVGDSTGASNMAAISIDRNSKFSGQLKFAGIIAIDGQVDGELVADRIVVNEGGIVNATVDGGTVVIAGTVKGDIRAHDELEILPNGIVDGSVTAPAITVRRGGRVEGRCTIGVPHQ